MLCCYVDSRPLLYGVLISMRRKTWSDVVAAGKEHLDADRALDCASKVVSDLVGLSTYLLSNQESGADFSVEKGIELAEKCANFNSVVGALSQEGPAGDMKESLMGNANKIQKFLIENHWGSELDFKDMLEHLFVWNDVRLHLEDNLKLPVKRALVEGAGLEGKLEVDICFWGPQHCE